ncbi:GSCOCG00005810001-RA-CDS [Cotesia congregata]|nr:GSCOCG00005810001-RA-CDS [Cotesia congregata]
MMIKINLLILLILFIFVNSGESLKCWYCTPTVKPKCEDEFIKSNVIEQECNYNNSYPVCRTMKSFFSNGKVRVIIRDCNRRIMYNNDFAAQYMNSTGEAYVVKTIISYCDTDFCNSAKSIYSGHKVVFLIIISFLCIFKSLH